MPTNISRMTRKDKSALNKQVYAVATKLRRAASDPTRITLELNKTNRTDEECIDQICLLVSSGLTLKSALKHAEIQLFQWHYWKKDNKYNLLTKYEDAITCHLQTLADDSLDILDNLREERRVKIKEYNDKLEAFNIAMAAWRGLPKEERAETARPAEPVYHGPSDLDLKIAEACVKEREWHLEKRSREFEAKKAADIAKTEINNTLNVRIETREEARRFLTERGMLIDNLMDGGVQELHKDDL